MGHSSSADAAAFRNAAANGQVGIDPDAAHTVLNKIRNGKDVVESLLNDSAALATSPRIGENPVGNAIAAKFSGRAAGGNESYGDALRNLFTQYEQAEQAILTAMSRYNEVDQAGAEPFGGLA